MGRRYEEEKKQGRRTDLTSDQNDQKSATPTRDKIAKECGVASASIRRYAEFARSVDIIAQNLGEEVKDKIVFSFSCGIISPSFALIDRELLPLLQADLSAFPYPRIDILIASLAPVVSEY